MFFLLGIFWFLFLSCFLSWPQSGRQRTHLSTFQISFFKTILSSKSVRTQETEPMKLNQRKVLKFKILKYPIYWCIFAQKRARLGWVIEESCCRHRTACSSWRRGGPGLSTVLLSWSRETPMFTHVHPYARPCSPMLTHVHPCSPICSPMFTHVHPCSPMFTHVHPCSPMFTHVHPCSPMFTQVKRHTHASILLSPDWWSANMCAQISHPSVWNKNSTT